MRLGSTGAPYSKIVRAKIVSEILNLLRGEGHPTGLVVLNRGGIEVKVDVAAERLSEITRGFLMFQNLREEVSKENGGATAMIGTKTGLVTGR